MTCSLVYRHHVAGTDFNASARRVRDENSGATQDGLSGTAQSAARIFRNVFGKANHWLLLKLVGTKSNRMGIGAQVRITTADGRSQWNEVTTSVGYASSSDSRVHFGLGANQLVKELEVRWPSGIRQIMRDVSGDRIVVVEEPKP